MPPFRPEDLSQWVSQPWCNGMPGGMVCGVTQDTRKLKPGDLYVAIRGERFDGHDFIEEAFGRGAAGALVDQEFQGCDHPVLKVRDTVRGLQDLARGYRQGWSGSTIGITGSVGKTTVKEMCAEMLSRQAETHCTAGNYNNHIGLPLTMLARPASACYGIFEVGMNHPGEISQLADLLQPDAVILTDIGNAHRESFASEEAIAREKSRLAERVASSGLVILDRDSRWYGLFLEGIRARVATVSLGGAADYAGRSSGNGILNVNGYDYAMPLPGEHIMRNALRAIALGLELGLVPEDIAEGISRFKNAPMRWQACEIDGIGFINDAYNANPLSMRAALRTFADLNGAGRKWAVLGGMHELGTTEAEEHEALGRFADELPLDGMIAVGARARGIQCPSVGACYACDSAAEAAQILKNHLTAGDRVLLKASRSERLEQVLDYFREN